MAGVFSVVVFTAAPSGMGAEAGGAYVKIDGREALLKSIDLFLNRDNVKQIQLVVLPDMLDEAKHRFAAHLGFSGVKLVSGGPRLIDQLAAAVSKLAAEATHVLLHDAARPAVPYSDIDCLLEEAEKHAAATLVTPLRTPLVEIDEGGQAVAYRSTNEFMQLLTPMVYSKQKFLDVVQNKREAHASELHLIKGSPLNVRVGGPGDAGFVKTMMNLLPKPKIRAPLSPFEEAQW